MRAQGLTETGASEIVGEEVDPDHAQNIARSIRRHLQKIAAREVGPTGDSPAGAGLGVLYDLLSKRLEALDHEALKLCHTEAQYSAVVARTEAIKEVVERRLTQLEALTTEQRTAQARQLLVSLEDPLLDPSAIAEREMQVLAALMKKAHDLLSAIEMWRSMEPSV
jgi:hypothetical protein